MLLQPQKCLYSVSQVPKLPPGKRKLPDNPSLEMLKKIKMDTEAPPVPSSSTSPAQGGAKGKRAVTMEEVPDEDTDMDAGDFAPGGDADYFAEEDDEGRFFGGGLTSEQKEILNIFDSAGTSGTQDDVRRSARVLRQFNG